MLGAIVAMVFILLDIISENVKVIAEEIREEIVRIVTQTYLNLAHRSPYKFSF